MHVRPGALAILNLKPPVRQSNCQDVHYTLCEIIIVLFFTFQGKSKGRKGTAIEIEILVFGKVKLDVMYWLLRMAVPHSIGTTDCFNVCNIRNESIFRVKSIELYEFGSFIWRKSRNVFFDVTCHIAI